MNKLRLSVAAAMLMAGYGVEAGGDIAPVDPAPANSWSGFYTGIQAGYSWSKSARFQAVDSTGAFDSTDKMSLNSLNAGLYLGYNWLMDGNWLLGVEGEVNALSAKDKKSLKNNTNVTAELRQKREGSLRVRVGRLMGDYLPYVTGGVAWTIAETSTWYKTYPEMQNAEKSLTGWTVGAGVEMKINSNLHARLQYRYTDYGSQQFFYVNTDRVGPKVDKFRTHLLSLGVDYHFGSGRQEASENSTLDPVSLKEWSGFYGGAQLGYNQGINSRFDAVSNGSVRDTAQLDMNGLAGGIYLGYNRILSDQWLIGLEGGWNYLNVDDRETLENQTDVTVKLTQKWDAALRMRVGLLMGDYLPYLTGGLAWTNVQVCTERSDGSPRVEQAEQIMTGWTVGTGVEMKLTDRVHARVEYRYTDYGNGMFFGVAEKEDGPQVSKLTSHMVNVGVDYRF